MPQNIDTSFVKSYETEVFEAFQRQGSQLRGTVRVKTVKGAMDTTMQKIGKGSAVSKPRGGEIPLMNADRGTVTITLTDRYARELVDKLDELKINHDERAILTNAITWALGRAMDQDIITAADQATGYIDNGSPSVWTAASGPVAALETFGKDDVPLDGQTYAIVPWEAWGDLLGIQQFSSAEYVSDQPWTARVPSKVWAGFTWMPYSGCTASGADKFCYFWHKTAMGAAIGAEISVDVTWNGERAAHNIVGSMSMGAKLIDQTGVKRKLYDL
jgi:hypothetical protein